MKNYEKSFGLTANRGLSALPNENLKWKLQAADGTYFGDVSWSAYEAIQKDSLDKYRPASAKEKKVLDKYKMYFAEESIAAESKKNNETKKKSGTKKDDFGNWLLKQADAGAAAFNKGLSATIDHILPTEFLGRYDFISKWNDYNSSALERTSKVAQKSSKTRGKGWKTAGDIVSALVAALPNTILAFFSSGASLGVGGATTLNSSITTASGASVMLGEAVKKMIKNPAYWSSIVQTLGTDYEEAKEQGANDVVASATAILTSAINAGIEVGSGIERFPSELKKNGKKAIFKWAKSTFEEGGEEVLQGIATSAMAKLMYDHNAPILSFSDDTAVVNPIKMAKEFGMGVAVGGVLGAGQATVSSGINRTNTTRTGKFFNDPDVVRNLIDTGLESPKDSESYKLAVKAENKKGKLSDYEIGKLYYANVEQINKEESVLLSTNRALSSTETNMEVKPQQTVPEQNTDSFPEPNINETTGEEAQAVDAVTTQSVKAGDTFTDTKTGNTIRVVSRDENSTVIEIDTGAKIEQRSYPNSQADTLITNTQFEQIEPAAVPEDEISGDVPSSDMIPAKKDAQVFNILTRNLKNAASKLGILDTAFFERLKNVNVQSLSAEDVSLINSEFHRIFESSDNVRVTEWLSGIDRIEQKLTNLNKMGETITETGVAGVPEIITLNRYESIYDVFADAEIIYVSEDAITDKKIAIPLTKESLAQVEKTTNAEFTGDSRLSIMHLYHKDNSVVIKGDPKIFGDSYVFEAGGKYYAVRQKHLDAVNNGKNIVAAGDNPRIPWTVHDENGNLEALIMPVVPKEMTTEKFNSLSSVSEVVGKKYGETADTIKKADSVTETPENVADTKVLLPVGQLLENYSGTVDGILTVSDEEAKELADKRAAVEVLKNTPAVILDNVEEAKDLKVIINYNKLYLAVRKNGVFKGHYHNLGAKIAKKLPEFLKSPDAIIQLANGRLNLFATVKTEKGNNGIVSVELNSTKDINGKYEDYNVVVTLFSSNDKYAQNLIKGDGVIEKYKREDLSQVNPQLYKWLAIINDKSSVDNIVSRDNDIVNNSVRNNAENDTLGTYDVDSADKVRYSFDSDSDLQSDSDSGIMDAEIGGDENGNIGEYDTGREAVLRENEKNRLHGRTNQEKHSRNQGNTSGREGKNVSTDGGEHGSGRNPRTKEGKIRNVFHGTPYKFKRFLKSYVDMGIHFGSEAQAKERLSSDKGYITEFELELKNPLVPGDIFGERSPEQYVDELIKKSQLNAEEKQTLKKRFDEYGKRDVSMSAKRSLDAKLFHGNYQLMTEIINDGIYVGIALIDDNSDVNMVPMLNLIDKNQLMNIIGFESTAKLLREKVLSEKIKEVLAPYIFEQAVPFEEQYLKLRKIEEILQSFGYDGFAYQNENEGDGWSYAVFDDSQIIRAKDSDAKYSIEGENINEQTGDILSDDGSKRQNSTSARKQVKTVDGRSSRYREGRSTTYQRRKLCQTLRTAGNTETKVVHGHKCEVIPSQHYDKRMQKLVDKNKADGIDETILITGQATLPFVKDKNGNPKTARGVFIETTSGKKIAIIQYDNKHYMPEQISDHEKVHEDFNSKRTQTVKNLIRNSLSVREKKDVLNRLSKDYDGVIEGNEEAIFEEFVANVLSGMNEYTMQFNDVVKAYWAGDDASIDGFKVSEYAESIDAGGVNADVVDVVDSGEEIQQSRQIIVPYNENVQLREYIMSVNHRNDTYKSVDCKEIGDNFYIWRNTDSTSYKILHSIPIVGNESYIDLIRSEIDGVDIAKDRVFNLYQSFDGKHGNGDWSGVIDKDPRSRNGNDTLSYGKLSGGGPNADRRRDIGKSNRDKSNHKIKYSLADDGEYDFMDIWNEKLKEYSAIPTGEKPSRDIQVPKKISKTDVVSQFARTMMEAGVTPDDAVSEFEKRILDGEMTHEVITNEYASKWATERIKYLGFEEALNEWSVLFRSGRVGKRELALGMELYNQCINSKDTKNAMKIAAELAAEATHAGQTLQACRILKTMSPDGQMYYLEKSIQKMNEEFREKLGDKFNNIELDEKLMEEFFTESDESKRDAVYDKICQDIAEQIPATMLDKWNSWRYLAMLGNPRTHLRNLAGNAVFVPAIRLKNYVGAIIESAANVQVSERTKSFHKSKEAVKFAEKDFNEMVKTLQGENAKYAVTSDIEGKRTIFKTKWLENLRTKNFDFLEKEDMWFLRMHYVDALARIITVRKFDVSDIDARTLDTIRAYAVKEAQAATYRDANALSDALNKIQRRAEQSSKKAIRATSVLVEGVMPFKKTPLNIAKQGVNYSPIGILNGTYKTLKNLYSGKAYSTTEVIDTFAKGLTGTGLILLGLFLASLGALSGGTDENKKKREFDKMVGEQSYALKIGNSSYTIDWMTPLCLPLFIGAELHKLTKDEFSFADITSAVSTVTEPLLELSVFSGVSGVIESAQYSETNALYAIAYDMFTGYLSQALPTIGGQISKILDDTKREYYYVDKNSEIPRGLQNIIGQAASKIPYASRLFEPSIDEWGREEKYGGTFERVFESSLSPGYYSKEAYTAVDKEINALYERTGESDVLPTIQQKYYVEDKVYYHMSAKDYTEVKRLRGQKSFSKVKKLIGSSKYRAMNDEEKVKAIRKCYKDAGKETKEKMLDKVKDRK